MFEKELIKRVKKFISDLGIIVAQFAENVGIGRSTFYFWINGTYSLPKAKLETIDNYIARFGY